MHAQSHKQLNPRFLCEIVDNLRDHSQVLPLEPPGTSAECSDQQKATLEELNDGEDGGEGAGM